MVFGLFKRNPKPAPAALPAEAAADDVQPLDAEAFDARMREAQAAFQERDYERSRSILLEVVASNPESTFARTKLGICHNLLGDAGLGRDVLLAVVEAEPENVEALKFLAACYYDLGDHVPALGVLDRAKALAPEDPDLVQLLGDIYVVFGRVEAGIEEYVRVSDLTPNSEVIIDRFERAGQLAEVRTSFYLEPYPRIVQRRERVLRRMLAEHRRKGLDPDRLATLLAILSGSKETFAKAVQLAVAAIDGPQTQYLANHIHRILVTQGDAQRALESVERLCASHPEWTDLKFHLGRLWVGTGADHWVAGWRLMSETVTLDRHFHHSHGVPIWEGQKLGSGKLLVYQDQGAGDAILAFRFLPLLVRRGIRFVVWVQPPLADLAARIPEVETVLRTEKLPDVDEHHCTHAISFFGLIGALYVGMDEIKDPPLVRPAPEQAPELRERIRALPGKRIGLLYGGNPRRRDDWVRSVPTDDILRLRAVEGVSWVNLMVDVRPDKEQVLQALSAIDPMADVRSFADTAAMVEELDAVVAVDASVAHIAGLLRKPVWVLAPTIHDWRWQIGSTLSPWWPTAQVLRSEAPGVWKKVIDRLLVELPEFVRGEKARVSESSPA
jgi:tetratricopeptide (TPR) repeat protein